MFLHSYVLFIYAGAADRCCACVCEHVSERMCEVDTALYNDRTKSNHKAGKKNKRETNKQGKELMKKGASKRQSKDKLPRRKRGERTIAIATAVFLLSSNNCVMSDASSWK